MHGSDKLYESARDWKEYTAAQNPLPKPAKGVKVISASGTPVSLTLTKLDGSSEDLTLLVEGDREDVQFTAVTAIGGGVARYRVYFA